MGMVSSKRASAREKEGEREKGGGEREENKGTYSVPGTTRGRASRRPSHTRATSMAAERASREPCGGLRRREKERERGERREGGEKQREETKCLLCASPLSFSFSWRCASASLVQLRHPRRAPSPARLPVCRAAARPRPQLGSASWTKTKKRAMAGKVDDSEALAARERLLQRSKAAALRRAAAEKKHGDEEGEHGEHGGPRPAASPPQTTTTAAAAAASSAAAETDTAAAAGRPRPSAAAQGAGGEGGAAADALAGLGVRVARQGDMEQLLDRRLEADAARREAVIRADRARMRLEVRTAAAVQCRRADPCERGEIEKKKTKRDKERERERERQWSRTGQH